MSRIWNSSAAAAAAQPFSQNRIYIIAIKTTSSDSADLFLFTIYAVVSRFALPDCAVAELASSYQSRLPALDDSLLCAEGEPFIDTCSHILGSSSSRGGVVAMFPGSPHYSFSPERPSHFLSLYFLPGPFFSFNHGGWLAFAPLFPHKALQPEQGWAYKIRLARRHAGYFPQLGDEDS